MRSACWGRSWRASAHYGNFIKKETKYNACIYVVIPVTNTTLDGGNIFIVFDISILYIYGIIGLKIKQIKNGSVDRNVEK